MIQAVLVIVALVTILVGVRSPAPARTPAPADPATWRDAFAIGALLAAHTPELLLMRAASNLPGFLPADARTHAIVARRLFDGGIGSGWVDSYLGGFPLASHYPIVGWVLTGLPMALGVSPVNATNWVCFGCIVATPVLAYLLARRLGATVLSSLAGTLLVVWTSPLNPFVGSTATYFHLGLVSQCVVMPLLVLWLASVLVGRNLAWAALWANLSFLAHPQVALGAAILLTVAVAAARRRQWALNAGASLGSAALVSAVVYGYGMLHLGLPFGWPVIPRWMQLGFGPDRLVDWFWEGVLLDRDRLPILTGLWAASVVVLFARAKLAPARAALITSVLVVALSVVGPSLADAGRLGELALKVVQPLRILALVPLVAAASVIVALEQQRETMGRWFGRILPMRATQVVGAAVGVGIALPLALSHAGNANARIAAISASIAQGPCGAREPDEAQFQALRAALGQLRGVRLWIDDREGAVPATCTAATGIESASALPLATTRGVGAHVGFAWQLVRLLAPEQPGLAERSEALGISHLLLGAELGPENAPGFELVGRYGPLHLYARRSGSSLFGLGCARERRSGPSATLGAGLLRDAGSEAQRTALFDPSEWIELRPDALPAGFDVVTEPCSIDGALLSSEAHANARHSVEVDAPGPVELVLRVTAHPAWRWKLDGRSVQPRMIFPAYYAVALPAGHHRVEVTAHWNPWVAAALLISVLGPLAWGIVVWRRR